jgi:hypothetical protein
VANGLLGSVEQRVGQVLQRYPETRDSHTALYIRYWQRHNPDVLADFGDPDLRFLFGVENWESIGRSARTLQNTLHLYESLETTQQYRLLYQQELEEYLAARKEVTPEIRFYLDETGNDGHGTYTGVGGVCVMNWKQYEVYEAALANWRVGLGPASIHFADIDRDLSRPLGLLQQLQHRRTGLLFIGYAMRARTTPREKLFTLFTQLVIDSLHRMKEEACINEPRYLRVIKEAEPGFDDALLEDLTKELKELVALNFPNQIVVHPVEAVVKGRNVLLECADLIASGMARREHFRTRNAKDELAEAVFNVAGFEDNADDGALFKLYPV